MKRALEILYVGNSVTAQRDGYVNHLHQSLQELSGRKHFSSKLALGAMGSLGIAAYWSRIVKRKSPDIVFIETSLADSGHATPLDLIHDSLLEVIRQAGSSGAFPVFLHLPRSDLYSHRIPVVKRIYDEVAKEFGIVTIDLSQDSNFIAPENYSYDGVHTTAAGAASAGRHIAKSFMEIMSRQDLDFKTPSGNLIEVKRFRSLSWQSMRISSPPELGRYKLEFEFAILMEGNKVEWKSSSNQLVALQVIIGPSSGVIQFETNGYKNSVQTWDPSSQNHTRLGLVLVPHDGIVAKEWTFQHISCDTAAKDLYGLPSEWVKTGESLRLIGVLEKIPYLR